MQLVCVIVPCTARCHGLPAHTPLRPLLISPLALSTGAARVLTHAGPCAAAPAQNMAAPAAVAAALPAQAKCAGAPKAGAAAAAILHAGVGGALLRPPPPRQRSAAARVRSRRGRRPRPWCTRAWGVLAGGGRRLASARQLCGCAQSGGGGRGLGARGRRGCAPAAVAASPALGSCAGVPKAGAAAAALVHAGVGGARLRPPPPRQCPAAARVCLRRRRRPRPWCTRALGVLAGGRRRLASAEQLCGCAQSGGGGRGLGARRLEGCSPAAAAASPALGICAGVPKAEAAAAALVHAGLGGARLRPPPPRQRSAAARVCPKRGRRPRPWCARASGVRAGGRRRLASARQLCGSASGGGGGRGLGARGARRRPPPPRQRSAAARVCLRRGRRPRPWCTRAWGVLACGRRLRTSAPQLHGCAQGGGGGRGLGARRRGGCSPAAAAAAPALGSSGRSPKAEAAAAGLVRAGLRFSFFFFSPPGWPSF